MKNMVANIFKSVRHNLHFQCCKILFYKFIKDSTLNDKNRKLNGRMGSYMKKLK